jgi:plasmid maintenance system antidote protein VapI
MALRLGKFFGNGPDLWMKMQADCDLWAARQKLGGALDAIKTAKTPADADDDKPRVAPRGRRG